MRSGTLPFQFDVGPALREIAMRADGRPDAVALRLPFLTVHVRPSAAERAAAARMVLRLGDRRVLSAQECCDGCIDAALGSLQAIRAYLVEERVALADEPGALSGLVELMLTAIRQFLTFEQGMPRATPAFSGEEFYRDGEIRQTYIDALEQLRDHLSRCLSLVAVVAGMKVPADGLIAGYVGAWSAAAYAPVDVAALVR